MTDFETLATKLENSPNYRVLSKIERLTTFHPLDGRKTRRGLLVDVETTGLDTKTDTIIELGCILFEYGHDGTIYRVVDEYNGLQDPGHSLPPEITELTGITDAELENQSLDEVRIGQLIEQTDFVVAHNSGFDRPMLERRFPKFTQLPWGCSLKSVDWKSEGISSAKLDYILFKLGKFHEGHRAVEDCHATLFALTTSLPKSHNTAMAQILDKAREPDYRIFAYKAPFDIKDDLKARGYRWSDGSDGKAKSWYIDVSKEELEQEKEYLAGCRIPGGYVPVLKLLPIDLYTDRTLRLPSSD